MKLAEQNLIRQHLLHLGLNQAGHRAGAKGFVIALLRQITARGRRQRDGHFALGELLNQFLDELFNHPFNGLHGQSPKMHDGVQAVAEFRAEELLNRLLILALIGDIAKANGVRRHLASAGIAGHDDNHMPEVSLLAVIVGQGGVVHHLQ